MEALGVFLKAVSWRERLQARVLGEKTAGWVKTGSDLGKWNGTYPPGSNAEARSQIRIKTKDTFRDRQLTLDVPVARRMRLFSQIGPTSERLHTINPSYRAGDGVPGRRAWISGWGLASAPVVTPNVR